MQFYDPSQTSDPSLTTIRNSLQLSKNIGTIDTVERLPHIQFGSFFVLHMVSLSLIEHGSSQTKNGLQQRTY